MNKIERLGACIAIERLTRIQFDREQNEESRKAWINARKQVDEALKEALAFEGSLANLAAAVTDTGGCGDHGCLIRTPTGMATNGGCRCKNRPMVFNRLVRLYKRIVDER